MEERKRTEVVEELDEGNLKAKRKVGGKEESGEDVHVRDSSGNGPKSHQNHSFTWIIKTIKDLCHKCRSRKCNWGRQTNSEDEDKEDEEEDEEKKEEKEEEEDDDDKKKEKVFPEKQTLIEGLQLTLPKGRWGSFLAGQPTRPTQSLIRVLELSGLISSLPHACPQSSKPVFAGAAFPDLILDLAPGSAGDQA
ncbi:hypothetical protein BTVI_03939 [Pitangus sulphuratus]|nr:hypothetical protein BTVI_03939 [Pitangus sulphuratus]